MSQEGPEGVKRELGFAHQFSVLGNWDFHSVFYHREWDGLNATGNGKKKFKDCDWDFKIFCYWKWDFVTNAGPL